MLAPLRRLGRQAFVILVSQLSLYAPADDSVVARLVDHCQAFPEGRNPFTIPLPSASETPDQSSLPIGIFDSGVGGLTVMESILKLDAFDNDSLAPGPDGRPDFAQERFIYFGDQANMPYGNYPAANRTDYLRELILKDALFLLGHRYHPGPGLPPRFDKPSVKALVIACNTATAYGLEDVRTLLAKLQIPVVVVGVVEAGARGLLQAPEPGAVGVLATVGTCASQAYPRAIQRARGLAGRPAAVVTQQGSPALAGVIEGDALYPQSLTEQIAADVTALASAHRQSGATQPLSKIILGCTHFPLVQPQIQAALLSLRESPEWSALISADLTFIDPAEWTARELFRELATRRLRSKTPATTGPAPRDKFFISVPQPTCPGIRLNPQGSLDPEYKYSREAGALDVEDTVAVPLTLRHLPDSSRQLLQTRLPQVWQQFLSSTAAASDK